MSETNEQFALRIASEFIENSGVMGKEMDTQFLALAIERAIMRGYIQGAEFALDAFKAATVPADRPSADDSYPHTEIEGAMP